VVEFGFVPWRRDVVNEVEHHLSARLNNTVRHIADWDGSMPFNPVKRHEQPAPVFGVTVDGREMHFSFSRDSNSNETRLRFGNGAGPDTEGNRRLRGRSEKYDQQVFESGGLDFSFMSDPDHTISNEMQMNLDSQEDFDWIYDEVSCYLGLGSLSNPLDMLKPMKDVGAITFQVNNKAGDESIAMAWGKLAPYSSSQDSIIKDVDISEGAEENALCELLRDSD
jgi:hypothetical protein